MGIDYYKLLKQIESVIWQTEIIFANMRSKIIKSYAN